MTDLLSELSTPSDAELISRVRGGEADAYGELFARHVDAARRLARQLVKGPDVDDLVSEAFTKVLQVIQGGGGPDVAFRAYLLTAVRRIHVDRIRAGAKVQTSEDMTQFDPGVPFQDTAVAGFENSAAAKAFATLPERWQLVLWHLEVEGQKPADIAPMLGMSANSVSALAYRAREGLRQAFLTMHLADTPEADCRWTTEHLGGYVRKGLSRRDTAKVEAHLDGCRRCTAMYFELTEVNSNLSGLIAPLLLGAAATGYLASSGAGAAAAGAVGAFFGRAKDVVTSNSQAAMAAAVAAGVAAVAVGGFLLYGGPDSAPPQAGGPVESTSRPAPGTTPAPPTGGPERDRPQPSPSARAIPTTATPTPTTATPSAAVPVAAATSAPAAAATTTLPLPSPSPSAEPGPEPSEPPPSERPPPEQPRPPSIGSAAVSGRTLNVSVDDLPADATTLGLQIVSDSGSTILSTGELPAGCSSASDTRARCSLLAGRFGLGLARAAAARSFTGAFPLAFTSRISSDGLELTVRVDGSVVETRRVTRFAVADACESPHDRCAADFAMAPLVELAPDGDRRVDLQTRITGVPPSVDTLAFTLDGPAEFRATAAEADCRRASARRLVCRTGGAPGVTVGFPLFLAGNDNERVVTLSLELPAQGHRDSDPSTPTSRQSEPLRLQSDFAVELVRIDGEDDQRDVYQLRGSVTGIPADAEQVTLRLGADPDDPVVGFALEDAPPGCSLIDADTGEFTCNQLTGDFDFEVVATLDAERTGDVEVTLTLPSDGLPPGYTDPDPGDNSASETLPAPPPPYFVEPFVGTDRPERQTYHIVGTIARLPEGENVALVFEFEDPQQRFLGTHPEDDVDCELSDDGGPRSRRMTCLSNGRTEVPMQFDAWIPGGRPSATLVLRIGGGRVDTVAIRLPDDASAVDGHGRHVHGHLEVAAGGRAPRAR